MLDPYIVGQIIAGGLVLLVYWQNASGNGLIKVLWQGVGRILGRGLPDYAKLSGVPLPSPLPDFTIEKAKPRPYRPFRWQYHQHMALKKMDADWWIELESTYCKRIAQRVQLFAEHGKHIIDSLPGSEEASREVMEMAIQFICTRYPKQFEYDNWTGIFYNHILGSHFDTKTINPLVFLLRNIPEDFLITQEDKEKGLYIMTAGVSCSAVGWSIATKIGTPLHQIHGPVPDYKEKMQFSMDRYFSKLPCNKPIQRGSWGLEIGEPLFLQMDDPDWKHRTRQDADLNVSDIYLRVDWQTLRRLPRSRAIVFNFKALFTPITDFRHEPYIPKLVSKVLKEGNKAIMEYKGTWHIEHKAIPALDEWAREQEEKGLVPRDWKERSLDEDPFYPGWEERYSYY